VRELRLGSGGRLACPCRSARIGSHPGRRPERAHAAGYASASIQADYARRSQHWDAQGFARIDNALDRRYAGSVIVNEANGRYFESAPGRNWVVGIQGTLRF
jgi:hypothetical protein